MKVCLTIDVEDWFHSVLDKDKKQYAVDTWPKRKITINEPLKFLLDIFHKNGITATFFVLGWFAIYHPDIIKKIQDKGHEIASHGMTHVVNYELNYGQIKGEVFESKRVLEDVTGEPVLGYRATSYSISDSVLDEILRAGYRYDSSFFPSRGNGMYGSLSSDKLEELSSQGFKEFSIPVGSWQAIKIPFAGGTYFRLLPLWFIKKQILAARTSPLVFYFHPRDFPSRSDTTAFLSLSNRIRKNISIRSYGIRHNDKKLLNLICFLQSKNAEFVPLRSQL